MKNRQLLHYRHYYVQTADGAAIECSRRECFAPADNPSIPQRWYYSPDQEMAVRLYPGPTGDGTHKVNAADLKWQERQQERSSLCVAQIGAAKCEVTCDTCPCKGTCNLKATEKNGAGCKRKCQFCSEYISGTVELDKPDSNDDNAGEGGFDIPDDTANPEALIVKKETVTLIRTVIGSLPPAGQRLWSDLLSEKTKTQIAAERELTEGAIRKQVKKLSATLREDQKLSELLD